MQAPARTAPATGRQPRYRLDSQPGQPVQSSARARVEPRLRPRSITSAPSSPVATSRAQTWWNSLLELVSPLNRNSVAVFLEQMGMMIQNGLSPGAALASLADHQDDPRLGRVIENVSLAVHSGRTLSQAFARYPEVFPPTVLLVVRSGEEGGDIAGRLRRAGDLMQRQLDLQAQVKHAVAGPLATAAVCATVLLLVIKLVFPRFVALYAQLSLKLPLISKLIFLVVGALAHPLTMVLGLGALVAVIVHRRALRQELFDLLLWLPLTRPLVGKLLCASLCENLAYLYKDGVPVQRALEMLASTTPFAAHRFKLREAGRVLCLTGCLSEALKGLDYFPPVFHSMLFTGEESGTMDEMLSANRVLMEQEIEALLSGIKAMLEPALITVMGITMGVLFVGMFLPIYGILSSLGG